jgi:hypothetical protein
VTVRQIGVDELAALSRGVDVATTVLENAEPGGATLAALRSLAATSTALAKVKAQRPPEQRPDEVQEAIRGEMGTCVEHLLRHTREAASHLDRARAGLLDGLDLGPAVLAEIRRRVDGMLGVAPS